MSRQHFMSKDLSLLKSGVFADATITCGDRTWKVHKSIICRCEFFWKAFSGNFEEAQTNNVNISAEDFSSGLVDYAISFIYSGVANNIEELNVNDSVADACVRLWVIADFLVLRELQSEAVTILEKYCEEKVKALCVIGNEGEKMVLTGKDQDVLLAQFFRGVKTAYAQYPHSVPCQQELINFFYAVRAAVFGTTGFSRLMSKAPLQFSHELLMTTIDGRENKWSSGKDSEFHFLERKGKCTGCRERREKENRSWVIDPVGGSQYNWSVNVPWRCISCFEKHGFEDVDVDVDVDVDSEGEED